VCIQEQTEAIGGSLCCCVLLRETHSKCMLHASHAHPVRRYSPPTLHMRPLTRPCSSATLTTDGSRRSAYTAEEIRAVLAHADLHGVLVVPELDVPGHTHSWAPYVADCPHRTLHNKGAWGAPLNFDHPKLFLMLRSVFSEVRFTPLRRGPAASSLALPCEHLTT
jgi:hypothetical protein